MRSRCSPNQLMFDGFETEFEKWLEPDNRGVLLSRVIPWEELSAAYEMSLSVHTGRPAKDGRLVIGAVIIKHKLCLSDEETIEQIRENPYLQYFVGFTAFHKEQAFAPSLFVEIRRRMGPEVFARFENSIIARLSEHQKPETARDDDQTTPPDQQSTTHQGKLIVDATVVEQAIRYPTDLSLLNEAREISEAIIDTLHLLSGMKKKVRTYRRKARSDYLGLVKRRRPGTKRRRKAIGQQLRYLNRNLGHIEAMLDILPGLKIPLSPKQLRRYWIIRHLYDQQKQMFDSRTRRCDDRIVSIHQPHVRPIVRGKQNKAVEFGAKLGVSLNGDGVACVDHLSWDAYNEGHDLPTQVEAYRQRHGHYPEKVLADPLYGTRANRKFLKEKGIEFAGKPLGRPPKTTRSEQAASKQKRQKDYRERIPIEGKFGQGKNGYDLNYIRARTAKTSEAWIRSIFLVMNLLVLIRFLFVWIPTHMSRRVATDWEAKLCRLCAVAGRWANKQKQPTLLGTPF
ncbi:MAG: IS5 family transposase [Rhodospirillaceae bacterium]|nr:IS5 family transposase [Rhodospirillaceae bacterium]